LRILIVGAGGQVGEKVGVSAQGRGHQVIAAYKSRLPRAKFSETVILDKTRAEDVEKAISSSRPDVVIDTAAMHNVDYCETHPEEAFSVNRDGTQNLARAANQVGAKFIFISTDFVFDGDGAPYTEESPTRPLSIYAASKVAGEKVTLASNARNVVCRPAVIFSWMNTQTGSSSSGKPLNFGAWLVSQLVEKKEVRIVTDQVTSPTLADDLAEAILAISEDSSASGLFHTAGRTPLSRYVFSVQLADRLGLDRNLIHPIESSQLKQIAKRPANSSLLSERLKKVVGYEMMNIDQALGAFASQVKTLNA
jgi:dTDP-4-dehydrorhamnose reductase